jgi:hypothetical protein
MVDFNGSGMPVSPPGEMSMRSDMTAQGAMDIPDAAYGEQAEFQALQGGAPMAGGPAMPPPVGMMAPTTMPDVPLTDGIPSGPGAGPEALMPQTTVVDTDMKMLGKYLPQFEKMAAQEDSTESFRLWVRYLRGSVGQGMQA